MSTPKIVAVDLFCGAGGLTYGLRKAGIEVIAGIDIDIHSKYPYEKNNKVPFFQKDICTISSEEIRNMYIGYEDSYKLLAGCAPCQPFSGYSNGKDLSRDKKWPLLHEFARLIREILPEFVTMENVPQVVKHSVYEDFVENLVALGYSVHSQTVHCPDYGIPQSRKRHVLLASRVSEISLITTSPKKYKTVREAIGNLEPLEAGQQSYIDPLHVCSMLTKKNLMRIKASKPGGTWRDWPEELIAECHKKQSGKSYPSVYGRMEWDSPAPTMTTQCFGFGNGRFGHPEQHRGISLREAALFQTFPKSYKFYDSKKETLKIKTIGTLIGNAVPPVLGKFIGRSIIKSI
jgi:DNA (cytosine-5)-methyltransferase 1